MKEFTHPPADETKPPLMHACSNEALGGNADEDIFSVTEIELEEVSIDGICGVY